MRICVFCGSRRGSNVQYANAARRMGETLAAQKIGLVYGGGRIGLMGIVADAALAAGGSVFGVMTRALVDREIQHTGLTELHVVESMHERKMKMAELSDAFVAMPGAAGTLDEIFEQWTWAQLGIHRKPCGFLNVDGYFDSLREMIARMEHDAFLQAEHASMLIFETEPEAIVRAFREYTPPLAKFDSVRTVSAPEP